jgi:uncharacterized protein (TIGR00369 family)
MADERANATDLTDLAALGARFEAMPYARSLGIRVERIAPERVRLRVPYKDENSNPGKALHGGVAASTIGIAGALAAWTGFRPSPALEASTLDLSVSYLAAAIGEDIVAEAAVLRRGKEIVYSEVDVRNDAGKAIAKGLVTYRGLDGALQPPAASRQREVVPDAVVPAPPAGGGAEDVPTLARTIVSVPFMARLGLTITYMREGRARITMPYDPAHGDGAGALHEGALAALIDTTGAMASWSITGIDFRYKASTVGIHVSYHARAVGESVAAVAQTLRRNNEIFLNEVAVRGATSARLLATGSVTYRIVVPDESG